MLMAIREWYLVIDQNQFMFIQLGLKFSLTVYLKSLPTIFLLVTSVRHDDLDDHDDFWHDRPLLIWNTRAAIKVAVSQVTSIINIKALVRSIHFNMMMIPRICQKMIILRLLVSQIPFPVGDASVLNFLIFQNCNKIQIKTRFKIISLRIDGEFVH